MKIVIEVELGNDAMRTMDDVVTALDEHFCAQALGPHELQEGEDGRIRDLNGNTVGRWEVVPASQS